MKILIVTVAGLSNRFSKSIGRDVLKCIYYDNDISESLIYRLLHQPVQFDKYIIVGGYKFDELQKFINENLADYKEKTDLVFNEHFSDYGSGYSLYCGLKAAMNYSFDQIVFAEGDLFLDEQAFTTIFESNKSVITSNKDPILASKAVAYYYDVNGKIHYIYDTGHSALQINEPFLAIYNSGQVWKFSDSACLRQVYEEMSDEQWQGTNLVLVEKYFGRISPEDFINVQFDEWINCNTVDDFRLTR